PDAARNIDYAGVLTSPAGIVPFLIRLTNAENCDWGAVGVWGLLLLGAAFLALFVWVESRAREPMIPLHLFRIRSFAISMIAVFTAMFGFFGAVVFLPLWYQVVDGASATASGYKLLPFLGGLILSSVISGQVVSRTGRYKWLAAGTDRARAGTGGHPQRPADERGWFWAERHGPDPSAVPGDFRGGLP